MERGREQQEERGKEGRKGAPGWTGREVQERAERGSEGQEPRLCALGLLGVDVDGMGPALPWTLALDPALCPSSWSSLPAHIWGAH